GPTKRSSSSRKRSASSRSRNSALAAAEEPGDADPQRAQRQRHHGRDRADQAEGAGAERVAAAVDEGVDEALGRVFLLAADDDVAELARGAGGEIVGRAARDLGHDEQ